MEEGAYLDLHVCDCVCFFEAGNLKNILGNGEGHGCLMGSWVVLKLSVIHPAISGFWQDNACLCGDGRVVRRCRVSQVTGASN